MTSAAIMVKTPVTSLSAALETSAQANRGEASAPLMKKKKKEITPIKTVAKDIKAPKVIADKAKVKKEPLDVPKAHTPEPKAQWCVLLFN